MQVETLRKLLFPRGNSKSMRSRLRHAKAQRIKDELDLDEKKREESTAAFLAQQVTLLMSESKDNDSNIEVPTSTSKKKKRKLRREAPLSEDDDID
jgi:sulfite reductase alpha subunit-like flavoprotein